MTADDPPVASTLPQAPPGYVVQSEDTSYWAERALFEQLRELDGPATAERIGAACRMMDELLLAGLRMEHPHADEEELRLRAAVSKYGAELMERFTGKALDGFLPRGT